MARFSSLRSDQGGVTKRPASGYPKGPTGDLMQVAEEPRADGKEGPSDHEQSAWMMLHCAQMKAGGDAGEP